MSILKGKTIEFIGKFAGKPAIKYNRTRGEFVLRVPDVYSGIYLEEAEFGCEDVWISEPDLWRMINAEKGSGMFLFSDEKGELDDTTYLGISYVQARWYLSINVLNQAKRASKRCGFPQWIELKKRVPRGGRVKGQKALSEMSADEIERIERLIADYDRIVANCCRHDWVEEYVGLERDIARYKGVRVESRKKIIERFTAVRQKWIKENE